MVMGKKKLLEFYEIKRNSLIFRFFFMRFFIGDFLIEVCIFLDVLLFYRYLSVNVCVYFYKFGGEFYYVYFL